MPGHPFTLSTTNSYWSATTAPDAATSARGFLSIDPTTGSSSEASITKTDATRLKWCVRGGGAADGF